MISLRTLILSFVVGLLSFALPGEAAFAEPHDAASSSELTKPSIGRLSDGKPYRIDSEGFQITDRLAELEVLVDDLKRQIYALENELVEKNALLGTDAEVPAEGAGIREVNLTADRKCTLPKARRPATSVAARGGCQPLVAPLNERVLQLEEQLEMNEQEAARRCEAQMVTLRDDVTKLKTALSARPSADAIEARTTEVLALRQAIDDSSIELTTARKTLGAKDSEINQLQTTIASLQQQVAESTVRARMTPTKSEPEEITREEIPAGQLTALKREINQKLGNVRNLISKRKNLKDRLKRTRSGVSIKLQALGTSSGQSLDALRRSAKAVSDQKGAEKVIRGLTEIEGILADDIAVLERLEKA